MMHAVHVGRNNNPSKQAVDAGGSRMLPWLNSDEALRMTSKAMTAIGGAPSTITSAAL